MQTSWLVILPPFIVLIAAFMTRHLNASLLIGLVVAAGIATQGNILATIVHLLTRLYEHVVCLDSIYLYGFLLAISTLIVILDKTGGAKGFAHALTKHLRSKRSVEISTILMSMSLFIDDYLSTLNVGYVMRPLSDKFYIPRVKLAFLVHSLSGLLVILMPISSWVAMITGQLDQAGISPLINANTTIIGDPFSIYVQAIPFIFYSLFIVGSVWFIVHRNISFGPMHTQEVIAEQTHNLFGGKAPLTVHTEEEENPQTGSLVDLVLPLALLVGIIICGILYAGGFYLFGGTHSFVEALQNNCYTGLILFVASIVTIIFTLGLTWIQGKIHLWQLPIIGKEGYHLIYSAIIMLMLVSTLGAILREDLHTGDYIASYLLGSLPIALLPFTVFVVASLCSIITGSSWGTITLLVPIALPILTAYAATSGPLTPDQLPLLFPLLGAIFAGSVCGDHISPLSQTTVMAAASCGAYVLDHIKTQLPYALPALICAAVSFIIAGYTCSYGLLTCWLASLVPGLVLTLVTLYLLHRCK
ncbi:MAG: Na+/H+ antiporter NhaC family protein [Candidatus Babeliales bacterium]